MIALGEPVPVLVTAETWLAHLGGVGEADAGELPAIRGRAKLPAPQQADLCARMSVLILVAHSSD